jgi:hypothetical protein
MIMKIGIRICVLFTILILGLAIGGSLTQAQQSGDSSSLHLTNSHANLPWSSQYVQQQLNPPLNVGGYVSVAISSFNDFLVMSYFDATNHSLIVASPVQGHIGNCGTNNNWECVTLDGGIGLAVGMYTSIDIWGNSLDNWKMGISYYDITHRALKAAIYTCYLGLCGWDIVTVSSPDYLDVSVGLYSSFKFDSTGNAAIAFFSFNSTQMTNILFYAEQVSGGGDCGEGGTVGLWECTEVTYGSGESRYASLDFSYDDVPYIAYYAADDGDLGLVYKSGMCGPELGWTCLDLDGYDGSDVGLYPSLIAPQYSGDSYRIAYHDKTNGHLKYYDSDWGEPVVVDEMATSLDPMGISMAMDNEGHPVIAYQRIESDFSPPELRIARPNTVYGEELYGNCGDPPPGYLFQYWRCNTLDNGGQYSEEADFAAIAINSYGMVGIAYTEYDSYFDVTSLKFIYQHLFRTLMPITTRQ